MDVDKLDRHICEKCFTCYRFGAETMVFMFRTTPKFDHILTACLECRAVDVLLGVSQALYDSLCPSVNVVRKPVATQVDRNRALSAIHTGKDGCDSFERDLRLEMLAESVKALFPQPEG